MLETIAIKFQPAAPPVKLGSTDVPAVQEGPGAGDFQGHLQAAQKSLRPDGGQSQEDKTDASQGAATKTNDSTQDADSVDSSDAVTEAPSAGKPDKAEVKKRTTDDEDKKVKGHEDDHSDDAQKVDAATVNARAVVTQVIVQQPVEPKTGGGEEIPEEGQKVAKGGGRGGKNRAAASGGKSEAKKDAGEEVKETDPAADENASEETSMRAAAFVKKVVAKGNEAAVPFPKVETGKPKVEKSTPQTVVRNPQKDDQENSGVQPDEANVPAPVNTTAKRRGDEQPESDAKGDSQNKEQGSAELGAAATAEHAESMLAKLGLEGSDTVSAGDKGTVKTAPAEKVENPPAAAAVGDDSRLKSADVAVKAQELPGGNGEGNRESTFDQIVMGLRGKLDARNGKAEIQLNPPNLGSLRVSVNFANGTLTAQFQSDNASVRDLLLSGMDKLKSVLQGQGLAVDKLAVSPQTNGNASGPQSVLPAQRFSDSANSDGRSTGNHGYSGQNQRQDTPRDRSFAAVWQEAREAPIDLVA